MYVLYIYTLYVHYGASNVMESTQVSQTKTTA